MRGSALIGLLKVLMLLFESARTRAVAIEAATAAYNNSNNDSPAVSPRRNHRKLENRPSSEVIPDAYIIILNDNVTVTAETIANEYGITIEHSYQHAIKGFSSRYIEVDILDRMLEDSRIWAVGEDGNLEIDQEEEEDDEETEDGAAAAVVQMQQQPAAPNHLDQIDQNVDGIYSYSYTGAGVHIYVVDAGIMASHVDFGGRVATPCFDDIGPCNTDTDSHGTHIASIAGKCWFYCLTSLLIISTSHF
jgi:subtilisin family serine protease